MAKTMSANSWHTSIIRERLFEFLLLHCIAHFPVCSRGALCPKMSAATPPLPRHSRTMRSYLGLLPRTINFVFPLQSRCRRHLRPRHACGIFSKSCHATLDARVNRALVAKNNLTPSLSQGEGERRESRPKRRLSCVTILSSKRRRRRGFLRYKRFSAL